MFNMPFQYHKLASTPDWKISRLYHDYDQDQDYEFYQAFEKLNAETFEIFWWEVILYVRWSVGF